MRAFAACLTVFLGLGALTALGATMAGCSDTSDAGSGGASGAATTAGAANAGGPSAGSGGDACTFKSTACTDCLMNKCGTQLAACAVDAACKAALQQLTPCACGGTSVDDCAATFAQDGGDPAFLATECYTTMCTDSCQ